MMEEKESFDLWCQQWQQKLQIANKEKLIAICLKLVDKLQSCGPIPEELKQELMKMNITETSRQDSIDDCADRLSGLNVNEPIVAASSADVASAELAEQTINQFQSSANVKRRLPCGIIELEDIYELKFIGENVEVRELQIEEYLGNEDNMILFLGEGNFTFSAAVAALRKTWNNVIASDLTVADKTYNELFRQVITNVLRRKDINIEEVREFVNLDYGKRKVIAVDATQLTESYTCEDPKPDALYFQCPWARNLPDLISRFFKSAAKFQKKDDVLFLGICTHDPYVDRYGLKPEVYQEHHSLEGVDAMFCGKMIARGYRHQIGYDPESLGTGQDIHDLVQRNHITLCFIKK